MRKPITFLFCLLLSNFLLGQVYTDYLGAGHDNGINVTSSDNYFRASADQTINGSGLDSRKMNASRFLSQATLGYDMSMIEALENLEFENWIDNQFSIMPSSLTSSLENVWQEVLNLHIANGENEDDVFGPAQIHFNYAWWTLNMTKSDLLRQRIAYSLSQIFVVSNNSDLGGRAEAVSSYYDVLINNCFGNFKDLLSEITLHPSMGFYLSHLNNPKADPANNVHPDENYAREIMQLFSIGLYELNIDGSYVLDSDGDPIPTYDNDDIKEFAKVFTGLGPGDINDNVTWTNAPYFGLGIWGTDMTVPMVMYEDFHENSSKSLLNGFIIPANQAGMTDIDQTIDHIFNHPNVGPFLALRLIQRLVTSNPSPQYVSRVAESFNDNGNGVRGDMKAVIKSILLDMEARGANAMQANHQGRLKEPFVRTIQIAKSVPHDSPLGRYWNNGYDISDRLKQFPMDAPSVFNFYNFDHSPNGPISDQNLVAPEFKIHNTSSSIQYLNLVHRWTVNETLWWSWHGNYGDPNVDINTTSIQAMAENPEVLLNYFDILYCNGQLTDETRKLIRDKSIQLTNGNYNHNRTRLIMYLLLLSPDYTITK